MTPKQNAGQARWSKLPDFLPVDKLITRFTHSSALTHTLSLSLSLHSPLLPPSPPFSPLL